MTTEPLDGLELNLRVARVFALAGFDTRPNAQDPAEHPVELPGVGPRPVDLVAELPALGIKLVGQNTGGTRLGTSKTAFIHDVEQLKLALGAQAGLIVWTRLQCSDEEAQYARDRGVTLWNLDTLRYFEAVVDALGSFAKYELINSLGLQTGEEALLYQTLALKFSQPNRDPRFDIFAFTITPDYLLKTCVVYRRAAGNASAYQRVLEKSRLPAVRKFLETGNVSDQINSPTKAGKWSANSPTRVFT